MFLKPDYDALRSARGFSWFVGSTYDALLGLTGIPIREFNLNPAAAIEAYQKGRPLLRDMFGPDIKLPGVATPPVSYGHANGLGCPLLFPEGGEVAHEHAFSSLEQGIEVLKKPVDFAKAGMAPFYIEFYRTLQNAFPDETVDFSYGLEGPLTTGYELRGDAFFYDLMDEPEKVREFLSLLTDSILEFHRFRCSVTGQPIKNPNGASLCDDIAAMVPPRLFPELVLPYWDRYFCGMTQGPRRAHVEDLRPEHLRYLEEIGLSHYDPSISPKVNPKMIHQKSRVPFGWRLGSFHYREMDCRDVENFVYQAAADGASVVYTHIESCMCTAIGVEKIHAFIRAARKVKEKIAQGAGREAIECCGVVKK